ncbi:MAG TPA: sugar ABC transporter substrate-binding protein, partial [Oribacterium sp.]|nr:sugar ABC transporter substrate-binding protein [Oribacterium sp.]
MKKEIVSAALCAAMFSSVLAGCGKQATTSGGTVNGDGVKEFTAFFAVPGSEINDDNEIQKIIAEKTGCKVKETWLTGQTAEEAVGTLIAGGEYPDFVDGGNAS